MKDSDPVHVHCLNNPLNIGLEVSLYSKPHSQIHRIQSLKIKV